MKYFVTLLFAFCAFLPLLLNSCDVHTPKYPQYELYITKITPDSLRAKKAEFITETVRAATNNLRTSDYEDVDDLVEEATESADKLYSVEVPTLVKRLKHDESIVINPKLMTKTELQILETLLNK